MKEEIKGNLARFYVRLGSVFIELFVKQNLLRKHYKLEKETTQLIVYFNDFISFDVLLSESLQKPYLIPKNIKTNLFQDDIYTAYCENIEAYIHSNRDMKTKFNDTTTLQDTLRLSIDRDYLCIFLSQLQQLYTTSIADKISYLFPLYKINFNMLYSQIPSASDDENTLIKSLIDFCIDFNNLFKDLCIIT